MNKLAGYGVSQGGRPINRRWARSIGPYGIYVYSVTFHNMGGTSSTRATLANIGGIRWPGRYMQTWGTYVDQSGTCKHRWDTTARTAQAPPPASTPPPLSRVGFWERRQRDSSS